MSDDSKDIPAKKLKLSRDLTSQQISESAPQPPAAEETTKPSPPIPESKLPGEINPPPTEAFVAPESNPSKPLAKGAFDPKNPFGKSLKEDEIGATKPDTDELQSEPSPQIHDDSAADLEEAVNSLNTQERAVASENSLLPSIITILVLVLILCGAGYGLWLVLQTPDSTASNTEETSKPTQASKSPIERAKATISEVYETNIEAITDSSSSSPIQQSSESSTTTTPILPVEQAETPVRTQPLPIKTVNAPISKAVAPAEDQTKSALVDANKARVSTYLATIHIGGVRQGVRPAVMIEGETFLVGDVIQAETGLKFDGIRDGRLAFRDSHEIVYLKSF